MNARLEDWCDIRQLVRMSIGTNKGTWWADPTFGSELWLLQRSGRVDGTTAGTLRRMVLECLQWLVDDGLAEKIECAAERSDKHRISYQVTVRRPNGGTEEVSEVWNAV